MNSTNHQSRFDVKPIDAQSALLAQDLFHAACSSCHCEYWHFEGTKNEWLHRLAFAPEENAAQFQTRAKVHSVPSKDDLEDKKGAEPLGFVAFTKDEPQTLVGWMKVMRGRYLPKLIGQSVYRQCDISFEDACVVACVLVHPSFRKQGVARALLKAAPQVLASFGVSKLYAFPRAREGGLPLHDEEAFMGPHVLFEELGYKRVAGEDPYPVYELALL